MAPHRKTVSRGTGGDEEDPERANETQARAKAPSDDPERDSPTQARAPRPARRGEADPERDNPTQARAPRPVRRVEGDPERDTKTQARGQRPSRPEADEDPEVSNQTVSRAVRPSDPEQNASTQARAPNPMRRGPGTAVRPRGSRGEEEDYRTSSSYGVEDDPGGSYHTGQTFQAMEEEEALAGSRSLEGDGLDALDPEIGSATKSVPALEEEEGQAAAQDEDEGADDANATRAGPPLKIEIISGPDTGKKRRFKGVRMVIGRTPGVDFQLSDQSVSRRHIELIHSDDGVMLRDLGSGNGTKVNGEKVAERKLEHGDEIGIGKTKLRFVDEAAAFQKAREEAERKEAEAKAAAEAEAEAAAAAEQAEAASAEAGEAEQSEGEAEEAAEGEGEAAEGTNARRRAVRTSRQDSEAPRGFKALSPKVRIAIIAVGVVLLLSIVFKLTRPPPPPPVDPAKVLADSKMQDARNAVREGNYAAAVAFIEDAEKLSPGIDKTKLGNTARDELAYVQTLDEARGYLENHRFEDARKTLAKAEKASAKSQELKQKLVAELEAAELQYKKEKIEEFIAAGEIEAAKSLLGELPVEEQAGPAEKINQFEAELEQQRQEEEKQARMDAASAAAYRKQKRAEEIAEAFRVVERKFAGGEWDRAASECARVIDAYQNDKDVYTRAKMLQGTMPNFGRNYEEGMKKFKQGALAQASKPLRLAYQQYQQIGLKANRYGQELEEKLGAASLAAGRDALLRNDLVTAWQNFRDAAKFDPSDSKARAGLDQVASRADDLFQEAYIVRDRDPREALRKFKIVVQVTDPGTTVHEKAKNQIAAMQP